MNQDRLLSLQRCLEVIQNFHWCIEGDRLIGCPLRHARGENIEIHEDNEESGPRRERRDSIVHYNPATGLGGQYDKDIRGEKVSMYEERSWHRIEIVLVAAGGGWCVTYLERSREDFDYWIDSSYKKTDDHKIRGSPWECEETLGPLEPEVLALEIARLLRGEPNRITSPAPGACAADHEEVRRLLRSELVQFDAPQPIHQQIAAFWDELVAARQRHEQKEEQARRAAEQERALAQARAEAAQKSEVQWRRIKSTTGGIGGAILGAVGGGTVGVMSWMVLIPVATIGSCLTGHRVGQETARYLFGGPIVLGILLGLLVGAVGGVEAASSKERIDD